MVGCRALIMGVLNVTPDSFSDGGRYEAVPDAVERAKAMVAEGADIIDIGGESTRPGAPRLSASEEASRVLPVIEALAEISVPISIDTYKAEVADAALRAGASLVNDISGLTMDAELASVVAHHRAGVVLGHIQGTPDTMQEAPTYDDVVAEVAAGLSASMSLARESGIAINAMALDPGLGFGKLFEHNVTLLRNLGTFRTLGRPLVVGLSRKSMTGHLDGSPPSERLPASLAGAALAVNWGADIVRVHDVKETRNALLFADRLVRSVG